MTFFIMWSIVSILLLIVFIICESTITNVRFLTVYKNPKRYLTVGWVLFTIVVLPALVLLYCVIVFVQVSQYLGLSTILRDIMTMKIFKK